MGSFARCDKVTSKWEGGKVDHPADPGGRTAFGVIQRVYDGYRDSKGLARRDVYKIEERERLDIYRNNYWRVVKGDSLPNGVDLVVYDTCVNSGPSRAIRVLQAALNALGVAQLSVDGNLGGATMGALALVTDHDKLVVEYCRRRQAFVQSLRTFKTFGKGWTRRISGINAQGTAWATGSIGTFLPVDAPAPGKAQGEDVTTTAVSVEKIAAPTAAATAVVGASEQIGLTDRMADAVTQLQPYEHLSKYIGYVVVALLMVGLLYTVWTAYKSWRATRALKLEGVADVGEYSYVDTGRRMGTQKSRGRARRSTGRRVQHVHKRRSNKGHDAHSRKGASRRRRA